MRKKKKIEFHVHTKYSMDSTMTMPFIILMCKIKQIDCVVITDHNEIAGAIKYKKKLKKYKIDVIVGEEIFTQKGEIIGLFLSKKIEPNLSVSETINQIKQQGGLVYVPHPYDKKRQKTVLLESEIKSNQYNIDFIEIHNGRNIKKEFSKEQKVIQERYNLLPIVGSDAHIFYELGRNFCYVDSYDRQKIVENIRTSEFKTKKCLKTAHFNTKLVKGIRLFLKGDFYGIIRNIKKRFGRV